MTVLDYAGSIKCYLTNNAIRTESSLFSMCWKGTTVMLLLSSVILTASEIIGKPIECLSELETNVIEHYCWISSTFTLPDYFQRESNERQKNYIEQSNLSPQMHHTDVFQAQPGVYSPMGYYDEDIEAKWTFHNYYQWVVFFLCAQAFFFYVPKMVWNYFEGGLMETLSDGLDNALTADQDGSKRKSVVDYMVTHISLHKYYAGQYFAMELTSLIMVFCQMFLVDFFLDNHFLLYGVQVLDYSNAIQEERVDPMIKIFPRMTKCNFHKFGPSGNIERHDAFCLLPLNILNEKIFILQWFWFIILAVLLLVLVAYRLALLCSTNLRVRVLHQFNKSVPLELVESFVRKTSIGDWWIMYSLSKNVDPLIYKDILTRLARRMEGNGDLYPYTPALYAESEF